MPKRDLFAQETRDGAEYRRDRLEEEHERLMRRIKWAVHRNDDAAIEWLEARLDAIEAEIDADLAPGREPTRFDSCRPR
ncbi:hypothetical protein [Halomonas ramblicola]|uniref:hypothetical protein n=1 Tax=Halomonas ramblicola TaxID=747349 RepID=UPI0025B5C781|nr:hypothetical protein [Halomonas ramblicola]MDN3521509.1 hypothetical protein [Halomonas ramblicola]